MPILDIGEAPRGMLAKQQRADFRAAQNGLNKAQRTLGSGNSAALMGQSSTQGFAAAKINRLTLDFIGGSRSADQDLFGDNRQLRGRGRLLGMNNPFARKFLQMFSQNIVGAEGVAMQPRVTSDTGADTAKTDKINQRLTEEWDNWCEKGSCTADGRFSFTELQRLVIKNVGREGENLIKAVYGMQFNETGFALQVLDNDQLDDSMMSQTPTGGQIRMGVEVDAYQRPLAYHLFDGHPGDQLTQGRERRRIPAEYIVHSVLSERPNQTRGYTPMSASILSMNQVDRLEEATVVASRASAAKFAVIEQTDSDDYDGEEDEDGNDTNADGTQFMSGNAGEIPVLGPNQHLNYIDPRFPTQTFEPFMRTLLRNIGTGLLVSYPTLGNDLSNVNFSSLRGGLLDERDSWRILQQWFIDQFVRPVFMLWLKTALMTTLSDITLSKKQMRQIAWHPRGWAWVDPLKDTDTAVLELGSGLNTATRILAAKGLDFQTIIDERAKELLYIKNKGLELGVDLTGDQAGKGVAAGAEADVVQPAAAAPAPPKKGRALEGAVRLSDKYREEDK